MLPFEESIAIIGAGSFGTALAINLANSGHDVRLWARREEAAEQMRRDRHNPTYLPDAILPDSIRVTSDLAEAVSGTGFWVIATPSQAVRQAAEPLIEFVTPDHIIVSVAKGIENETLLTTTGVLGDVFTSVPADNLGVLYGPSHAEEVAAGVPTAVVVAAHDISTAKRIQEVFMSPRFRVYLSPDVIGVEIAGSVKNILAIATGISEGVGYGDNTKAALITRGVAEIRRLGLAMGAEKQTFSGLAGIGDVVVTCMSQLSRNRYFGEQIGRGRTLAEIEEEMTMVAEGVRTTLSVHELAAKYNVEMPLSDAVFAILFEGKPPAQAVDELMSRTAKREDWLPTHLHSRN